MELIGPEAYSLSLLLKNREPQRRREDTHSVFLIACKVPSSHCQDDPPAMDFVTAAANLRMHIFSMNMKSRFDVKCKSSHGFPAGNWKQTCRIFCVLFSEYIALTNLKQFYDILISSAIPL